MKVSYYRHVGDKEGAVTAIRNVFTNIANGKFNTDVTLIRETASKEKKDAFKKALPCFTPAGVFDEGQTIDGCTSYNYLIVLDIDPEIPVAKDKKVPQEGTLEDWITAAKNDPFTYAAFVSPSGNGCKVFVKLVEGKGKWDNFKNFHYDAFSGLAAHYLDNYGIILDKSGKNINRLCFVSADPGLYINNMAQEFPVEAVERSTEFKKEYSGYESDDLIGTMNVAIKCVELHQHFVDSNRNNYIYELCCTLNRFGVDYEDSLHLIGQFFDLPGFPDPKSEWIKTIESAYKHHREEFGRVTPVIPDDAIKAPEMKMGEETDFYNIAKELFEKLKDIKLAKSLLIGYYGQKKKEGSGMKKERAVFILQKAWNDTAAGAGLEDLDSKIEYIMNVVGNDKVPSVIPQFSDEMRGGWTPGKVVGFIGTEGSYKTWYAMNEAVNAAKLGFDSAYFNLEMSDYQFLTRLALIVLHRDLDMEITQLKQTLAAKHVAEAFKAAFAEETRKLLNDVYAKIELALNGKLKVFSKQGLSEDEIAKLFQRYYVESNRHIRMAVIDGIWGLEQKFNDEIKSAMTSAKALKTLANDTNSTLLVLSHSKTGVAKHIRNQHDYVLGGRKILSNFDSFVSMSLCIDPAETDWDNADYRYRRGNIYMRMSDRRDGIIGEIDVISKLSPYVEFEATYDNPKDYEAKKPTGNSNGQPGEYSMRNKTRY